MKRNPFARARSKRREMPTTELSLAAMVDMMINILIFLLHLYGRGAMVTAPSDDLQLASSSAVEPLEVSVAVAVSRKSIDVAGLRVLDLELDEGGSRLPDGVVTEGKIPGLTAAIQQQLEQQRARAPADREVMAELLVQTDRRTPWSVLGPVLRSGAAAGAAKYRFVVASDGAAGPAARPLQP